LRPVKDVKELKRRLPFSDKVDVNSLQLVMAMAAIANGGNSCVLMWSRPVKDQQGRVVKETHPRWYEK